MLTSPSDRRTGDSDGRRWSRGRLLWAGGLWLVVASAAWAAPVAYWAFEEGSGAVARDGLGNADEGQVVRATWCPGRVGGGLRFAGTGGDGFVRVPDCEALRFESAFTVQFWWQKIGDAVQIFVRKGGGRSG